MIKIELDDEDAKILCYSLLFRNDDVPESSKTGMVFSKMLRQLGEQGVDYDS